jgi:hypothetical protein
MSLDARLQTHATFFVWFLARNMQTGRGSGCLLFPFEATMHAIIQIYLMWRSLTMPLPRQDARSIGDGRTELASVVLNNTSVFGFSVLSAAAAKVGCA